MSLAAATVQSPVRIDEHGVARVGATRVTLERIVTAFLQGATAEEITARYDALDLGDVYATIAYYLQHREEVDAYVAEQRRAAEKVRAENADLIQVVEVDELRARLLARK